MGFFVAQGLLHKVGSIHKGWVLRSMFEYKVVASPRRTKKIRGVKGTKNLFAEVLTEKMNEMARDGWEYLRAESLPVDEKTSLLKGRVETYQNVLVFRRLVENAETVPAGSEPFVSAPPVRPPETHEAAEHYTPVFSDVERLASQDDTPQDPAPENAATITRETSDAMDILRQRRVDLNE